MARAQYGPSFYQHGPQLKWVDMLACTAELCAVVHENFVKLCAESGGLQALIGVVGDQGLDRKTKTHRSRIRLTLASMMLRTLLAASALLTLLLVALPARAEPPHDAVTLTYLPSPRTVALCPDADFLAFEVELRLRYELFQPSAPNHLTVKVDRASNGLFRATGEMRDEGERVNFTREYNEIDCTAAMVAMALGVAIKFTKPPQDPEPSPPVPLPPASKAPALSPGSCPPAPKPVAPEPRKPPALPRVARPRAQAGLASVFAIGAAPGVVGGVAGFVGMRLGGYSLALEASALLAPSATVERFSTPAGWSYLVASLAGLGCYQRSWASVCARAEVSWLSFGNLEVSLENPQQAALGVGPRFAGEWVLTPWLALRGYGEVLLRSQLIQLLDPIKTSILWPGSMVSGTIGLGPVVSF